MSRTVWSVEDELLHDFARASDIAQSATQAKELTTAPAHANSVELERAPAFESDECLVDGDYVNISSDGSECRTEKAVDETPSLPEVPTSLKNKLHSAREMESQTRQRYQEAKETVLALEMLSREQADQEDANCACPQCSSLLESPAEVDDYFQLERNAFVRNERIEDLELERNQVLAAHARKNSLDDESSAYEEFERSYKQRRQELVEALAVEHYRLFIQRNVCLAQGIDPERFRHQRL